MIDQIDAREPSMIARIDETPTMPQRWLIEWTNPSRPDAPCRWWGGWRTKEAAQAAAEKLVHQMQTDHDLAAGTVRVVECGP